MATRRLVLSLLMMSCLMAPLMASSQADAPADKSNNNLATKPQPTTTTPPPTEKVQPLNPAAPADKPAAHNHARLKSARYRRTRPSTNERALLSAESANAATATKQWGSTLIPHGDHYDSVPVYDTTHPYAGYHSAYGNFGWGRKLSQATDSEQAEPIADAEGDDNESGKRALLAAESTNAATATKQWGSALVPHGDHYDSVPVYDTTHPNAGYHSAYGNTGGGSLWGALANGIADAILSGGDSHDHDHDHGRKLAQADAAADNDNNVEREAEAADEEEGNNRRLLAANSANAATATNHWGSNWGSSATTLVPHGDHYDRVPAYTNHYGGYFGGHGHHHGWGRKLSQATTEEDTQAEPIADAEGDNNESGKRNLLAANSANAASATKQWGSTLIPHGDHYDSVPVYDTTHPYAGYHSAYGNFGWGRKLSQATDSEQAEPIADAEGDNNDSGKRALLAAESANAATATKQWGSTLMPHGDHYDRVAVYDTTHPYAGYHSAYGNFGGHGGHNHGWGRKMLR